MSTTNPAYGASPALAAHSKDASTPGPTPASGAGNVHSNEHRAGLLDGISASAHQGIDHAKAAARQAAADAGSALRTEAGLAAEQAGKLLQSRPGMVFAITGMIALVLGFALGRRA